MRAFRSTLAVIVLTGCFGNAVQSGDDAHGSSGGSSTGGSGGMAEAAFACGCPKGSDVGITLTLAGGGQIVFADPPRFHDPDSVPGTTLPFNCDDAETPIYFNAKCTWEDLLEACNAEEGCLQIKRDSFVWLSPEGAELHSGAATFERDSLTFGADVSLDAVSGTLDASAALLGTFSGQVCHLHRDDCMK